MSVINIYDSNNQKIDSLYQWDINQNVRVTGVTATNNILCHFANKNRRTAYVVEPEIGQDGLHVDIPNALLQEAERISLYFFDGDAATESFKTIGAVVIPVIPRQRPDGYIYEENIKYITGKQIEDALNEIFDALDAASDQSDVWFGTCETSASTLIKEVTVPESFTKQEGTVLNIWFKYEDTSGHPKIEVGNDDPAYICFDSNGSHIVGSDHIWDNNKIISVVYTNQHWVLVGGSNASTTRYGITKLNDSVSSTSHTDAATPSAVKQAYDLASSAYNAASDAAAAIPSTYAGSQSAAGPANKAVSIPFGQLDSTSTSTVMTAQVDGITELRDGVCVWLMNGVVTSAANYTININSLGAKPVYSSMASATRTSTIFNANYTALLVYNSKRVSGGCWDYVYGYDSNTTYTPAKLGFCYVNSSSSSTTTIYGTNGSFVPINGGIICVNFMTDVGANATFNISSTGAFPLYYRGSRIGNNVIKNGDVATFVYYGERYYLLAIDRLGLIDNTPTANSGNLVTSGGVYSAIPTVPTISTDISTDAASDAKTASPKAVKTYVDGAIQTAISGAIGGSY